jgi:glycosyltransferase involved in cell wall biosynthesis
MVSFYFPPSFSGSALQALALSKALQCRGLGPSIVSANLTGSPTYEEYEGVPVHRLSISLARQWQIPSFWAALVRFLAARRREFDVFHAHGTNQHGTAALAGRVLRRPSILKVAMAANDLAFARQGRLRGSINRFMVHRFDRYVAITDEIAAEMTAEGIPASRVERLANGVDTAVFAPLDAAARERLRRDLQLPEGPLVSFVGILNARKNVDGALRIWQHAVARGAPGHLLLIGPADEGGERYRASLEAFVREHGLGARVSFLGSRKPVAPYLQASDLFLFPSRQEGLPNAVLEAMACGLPVVASRDAGLGDIIRDGENGATHDLGDESGFGGIVAGLLADAPARQRLGAAARETIVTRFSLDAVADRYVAIYHELLGRTDRKAP